MSKSLDSASTGADQNLTLMRRELLRWYAKNGRSFLWRQSHPDPYITLLSETMLQQTQASRVESVLPRFHERFPTIVALSEASNAQVIVAWAGMGYNSRALRLRDCAREIVTQHAATIPRDVDVLRKLPGIGDYTASALCAFAFHQRVVVIDVNIERIVRRVFALPESLRARDARTMFTALLVEWQGRSTSSRFYQALMDLGAMVCKARSVSCERCPLRSQCRSAYLPIPTQKPARAEPSHRGIPNRLWRGRCIELLRTAPKHQLNLHTLQHKLLDDANEHDSLWLNALLDKLQRDALIRRTKGFVQLAE